MNTFVVKNIFRSLFRDARYQHPELEGRIDQHIVGMTRLSALMSLVFWPLVMIMGYAARLPEAQVMIVGFSLFALLGAASIIGKYSRRRSHYFACFWYLTFPGIIALFVRLNMASMEEAVSPFRITQGEATFYHIPIELMDHVIGIFDRLVSINFFYAHIIIFLAMIPMKFRYLPAVLLLYITYGFLAFSDHPSKNWLMAFGLVLVIGICIKAIIEYMVVEASKKQLENEEAFRQVTMAVLERDLELARDIQLSIPVPEHIVTDQLEINFYLKAHHLVGGDWLAVRKDGDDGYWIMIVDAVGKGLQASLIIHAVQSLWTAANADFNPEKWIKLVNETLCEMGQKTSHCVTLGVLRVSSTRLTYWSAGHCPILIQSETGGRETYREVHAPGDMIGLSKNFKLNPKEFDLGTFADAHVVLCSDGLLDALPRGKRRREELRRIGSSFAPTLDSISADDDMTVVSIKMKSSSKEGRAA